MYYLYLDESGDEGDYDVSNDNSRDGSSRFFTLGGIIVKEENREHFKSKLDSIKSTFFAGIDLHTNFKLHYFDLRKDIPPFDMMSDETKFKIANGVFDAVKNIECNILSVTIDLHKHCITYQNPVKPRVYAILLIQERFQYFLEEYRSNGRVVYERFDINFKRAVDFGIDFLKSNPRFPSPTSIDNIEKEIINGDPVEEPILQFADFIAYPPYRKCRSRGKERRRYDEIKYRYYNLDHNFLMRRGNVEL